jgi:hypothetical protein
MRSTRCRRASNFGNKLVLVWFVSIGVRACRESGKGRRLPPGCFLSGDNGCHLELTARKGTLMTSLFTALFLLKMFLFSGVPLQWEPSQNNLGSTTYDGDRGLGWDPNGADSDRGAGWDPDGAQSDRGAGWDPNG